MHKSEVFGLALHLASRGEALAALTAGPHLQVCTVNPEMLLLARRDAAFREALQAMPACTVDSAALSLLLHAGAEAGRVPEPPRRIAGADLLQHALAACDAATLNVALLGRNAGRASGGYAQAYPGCRFVLIEEGGELPAGPAAVEPALLTRLRAAAPDLILVGFGAPKQEHWMLAAASALPQVRLMIGVGGSFGFGLSKRRAPGPFRAAGCEWLWRAFTEPGHWRRVAALLLRFPPRAAWWLMTGR